MKALRYCLCVMLILPALMAAADEARHPDKEALLWRMALAEQTALEQSHPLLRNPQLDLYLKTLISRLWKFVESDLPSMTIRVVHDPQPNAVVYANGVCYLTSGMLALVDSEDQLAMIIAHEVVHYIRRDSLGAFDMDMRSEATATRGGDHFTAAAEMRADMEGIGLIRQAGYCPGDVLGLLQRFHNQKAGMTYPRAASAMSFGKHIAGIETLLAAETTSSECKRASLGKVEFHLQIAPALLANAEAAVQRGIWDSAEMNLLDYFEVVPDNPQAHFIKGEIRLRRPERDVQGAIDAFETAIQLDQSFLPAYRELGALHFKAGRLKVARLFFEGYLAIAPEAPENTYIRGYLQLCRD